ncbi:hypothetical protein, partial [Nonomuraea sp. NPDC049784]|uniref:hypothetical protein n=1 Tax=Nonomuraea sp. NPDC049784 TaxID=3154361 RepID=UPI003408B185
MRARTAPDGPRAVDGGAEKKNGMPARRSRGGVWRSAPALIGGVLVVLMAVLAVERHAARVHRQDRGAAGGVRQAHLDRAV